MAEGPRVPAAAPPTFRWRLWLRALHRDAGYLAAGLTIVYALSGLAVNHISSWDPNFRNFSAVHDLGGPIVVPPGAAPAEANPDEALAAVVLARLHDPAKPRDVYRAADTQLDIVFDKRTLHVNPRTGLVVEEGQKPRPFLRVANWLHLNRGKRAWTWFADGFALFLVFLAVSGLFMIPGRKGLVGRGGVLVLLGAAVPLAYVIWSGGP